MELFEQRKGITPVIAIVLLLMVTVGAVGVVYTQFNSLVGNPSDEFEDQQRNQDTNIRISQLQTNADLPENINSLDHTPANYGNITMTLQNSGSVSRNTTSFVLSVSGADGSVPTSGAYCFTAEDSVILDPGDTYECNTGITYPQVTNEVEFEVLLTGSSKTWTETCRPDVTGAESCA
ncbi:archaellin/type IV pilin N-terminal domain-containing protein [Candidatus Nanosalina sp. VS9-1]|uniref:archaellin/type IV pilin N-terminal domain-containing protein n=1 Tax=Candidatus Nanosalina sp. VS9-1 TaxID=3388566 RepID=UPI0039DFA0CA